MRNELPSIDALIDMAKRDPDALENLRKHHIEQLIETAPEPMRKRLRGLQFQIDSRRQLHKNPMGACVMISQMMLDSLGRLNDALQGNAEDTQPQATAPAAVLRFPVAANH